MLEGTDLAEDYAEGKFQALTMEEYIAVLEDCIRSIPPEMVVHRLTGDGAKQRLLSPLWSADKKQVLNCLNRYLDEHEIVQGRWFQSQQDKRETNECL